MAGLRFSLAHGLADLHSLGRLHSLLGKALSELPRRETQDYFDNIDEEPTEEDFETHLKLKQWEADSLESSKEQVFFAMVFASFEHSSRRICENYLRDKDVKLKWRDLNGSPTERIKTIVQKIAKLEGLIPSGRWEMIVCAQKLRHLIVHDNGICDQAFGSQFAKVFPNIEFRPYGLSQETTYVSIPSYTTRHTRSEFEAFLVDLQDALKTGVAAL